MLYYWIWRQATGELLKNSGIVMASGYSGAGEGKNNPAYERIHNEGPIPVGWYTIGKPINTETHGPFVLPLTPDEDNSMYGRSGFLIHGDSISHPGTASQGCIILPRPVREVISQGSNRLQVVRE